MVRVGMALMISAHLSQRPRVGSKSLILPLGGTQVRYIQIFKLLFTLLEKILQQCKSEYNNIIIII